MNQFKAVFLGTENAAVQAGRRTRRSASAPAASTTTSTTSARTPTTTRSSRCSATGASATTSRRKRSPGRGSCSREVWKLDPTRLHVTVFEGDPANGIPRDDEAAELLEGGRRAARRTSTCGNKKDNFWEMGDTGPCGPCTEIHYDRTPGQDAAARSSTAGTAEVIEIWNLVFIQFNRNADQSADAAAGQARRYRHGLRADHAGAAGQERATTTRTCSRRSSRRFRR